MNRAWAVAACAALALAITGCGSDKSDKGGKSDKDGSILGTKPDKGSDAGSELAKLSAKEISKKAETELESAKSLRMKMDLTSAGTRQKMDLALDGSGNCAGSMEMGTEGSFELIKLSDKVWMKPDETFWKTQAGSDGAAAAELFKGKWVHGSTSDEMFKDMTDVCDLAGFQQSLDTDDSDDKMTKGTLVTVDGNKVIPVNGKSSDGDPMTLYVAAEGKPYPLKIVQKGTESGSIELTDWDKPVPTTTPPADQVVDMAKLQEQLGGA
ncbi:hypothetical protein [Streptomyces sp. SAJ15]|uniref:hypothetical protein n=1 Tax=Streptomyces sp. SAJ15 TaxID=2011095 RepID=UPI001642F8DA|nr:hypothetical protein [Streptomyces sp. SAJ15]